MYTKKQTKSPIITFSLKAQLISVVTFNNLSVRLTCKRHIQPQVRTYRREYPDCRQIPLCVLEFRSGLRLAGLFRQYRRWWMVLVV